MFHAWLHNVGLDNTILKTAVHGKYFLLSCNLNKFIMGIIPNAIMYLFFFRPLN